MSRPTRFPDRSGRLFWLLFWLAVGPLVLIFPASAWLYWTLERLQKVYLTTYAASSVGAGIPHGEMTIRWVMNTAPKRKPVPASAGDVVAGPEAKLPVSLSPQAIVEGWRGVAYSAPEKVPVDALAKGLQEYVYDGVSVWWLFGRPMLNSLAVLMLLYVLRLWMKQGFYAAATTGGTPRTQNQRPGAGLGFAVARRKDRRHTVSSTFREHAFTVAALWPKLPHPEAP